MLEVYASNSTYTLIVSVGSLKMRPSKRAGVVERGAERGD